MLLNICAQRERCRKLQKQSTHAIVPYYFAANKINYERWGTLALLQMLLLEGELKTECADGKIAVCQSYNSFNGTWTDMAVDKSVIKDTKGVWFILHYGICIRTCHLSINLFTFLKYI